MSFYLFFLSGLLGGVLGGMGMGGGTALIPLLTLLLGVSQAAAQGANLLSFFPMALFALQMHFKSGLIKKDGLPLLILPALVLSAAGALAAGALPALLLRRAFGALLTFLSIAGLVKRIKAGRRGA